MQGEAETIAFSQDLPFVTDCHRQTI